MNFYKRHLGAYAKKTAHLSLMEHGAYQVLLDTYYATEMSLPADKASLYRIAKAFTATERKAVDRVADQFFPVNGDGTRHNERADEELGAYRNQSDTNRRIAIERERQRREHEESTNRATDRPPDRDTIGSTVSEPNSEVREVQELLPPDGFSVFWRTWPMGPRKQAKGMCLTLWRKKKLEGRAEEIIRHVESMKRTEGWRTGFVPAPKVYLKEERWDGAEPDPGDGEKRMVM